MKYYKYIAFIIILLYINISVKEQYNTLYFMENVPQVWQENPANQPDYTWYMSFPILSSTAISVKNYGFKYNDLIHKGENEYKDSLIFDFKGLLDIAESKNYINTELNKELIAFGFGVKDMFFRFSMSNKTALRIEYPINLVRLIYEGNNTENFRGQSIPINFNTDLLNYNEFSLGMTKRITKNLHIGATIKMLFGTVAIQSEDFEVRLFTAQSGDSINLSTNLNINTNLPFETTNKEDSEFIDPEKIKLKDFDAAKDFGFTKNTGFAFDIGAIYELNKEVTLYASLIDVGRITWKNHAGNFTAKDEFPFKGFDLGNPTDDSDRLIYFDELGDSLSQLSNIKYETKNFSTALPTKIIFAGKYQLNNEISFGAYSKTKIFAGNVQQAFTLSANTRFFKWLGAGISYSIMNKRFDNLGFGLSINSKPLQIFIATDNIAGMFVPHKKYSASIIFGINVIFGKRFMPEIQPPQPSVNKT